MPQVKSRQWRERWTKPSASMGRVTVMMRVPGLQVRKRSMSRAFVSGLSATQLVKMWVAAPSSVWVMSPTAKVMPTARSGASTRATWSASSSTPWASAPSQRAAMSVRPRPAPRSTSRLPGPTPARLKMDTAVISGVSP